MPEGNTCYSDPRLLWLINRFLRAGILIEGQHAETSAGVAQGSAISPLLANVYLHYVLDDWFRSNLTQPIKQVWTTLNTKLLGHYQYYYVNDNWQICLKYREAARRLSLRWLRRRGDSNEISWQAYETYLRKHPLAIPGKIVDLIKLARARELLG